MRDPERIERIMGKLTAMWKRHPDLRLTQLLSVSEAFGGADSPDSILFYQEDDITEARLDKRGL